MFLVLVWKSRPTQNQSWLIRWETHFNRTYNGKSNQIIRHYQDHIMCVTIRTISRPKKARVFYSLVYIIIIVLGIHQPLSDENVWFQSMVCNILPGKDKSFSFSAERASGFNLSGSFGWWSSRVPIETTWNHSILFDLHNHCF